MQVSKRDWFKGVALAAAIMAPAGAVFAQSRGRRGPAAGQAAPVAKDEAEKRVLDVLDDIDRNQRYLNVGRDDGRLLRILAQSIGARTVVELGTSTGYSGLWLLLALQATQGRLTTYEIDAGRARMASDNFKRAGLAERATVVVGDAHQEVTKLKGPIDMVFVDADKEGYLDYLQKLRPLLRPGGLFVADNMSRPAPDPRYVHAVTTDPALETIFLNMQGTGVGVTLKKG